MYCPSKVGTNLACQVNSGTKNNGAQTTDIWQNSNGMVTRTAFGNKKSMPIIHSSNAIMMNNVEKYCNPTVLAVKASAKGLAGLKPSSFIKPNQKNITKSEILATIR